ncbi:leucine-rich repeat domain-containing protein [Bdellovibrio sp. HCB2-146]|uniref:Kelch repeat-containing protein n=1 Tax=Bdellovibrio sp. HCB2-146 TaxID=3394362 RepID=UPI0039BD0C21
MELSIKNILSFSFSLLLMTSMMAHAESTIPVNMDNQNYRPLGAGFDSRKSVFRGDCVGGTSSSQQLASGKLDLKLEISQESLAKKLGMDIGGRYRSGVTTTTAGAEFLNESKSNGYSISYSYVAENLYRDYLENKADTPVQARPGIAGYLNNQRRFFENCGDEYVYARDMAARLFVNVSISFVSKFERNLFTARFGVDSPMYSMQSSLENSSKSFSSNSQIHVMVLQVGGDPAKMGKILCPRNHDQKIDPECENNSRRVIECSFGDIKPCMDVLANVIAYANAQDGDNFPSQIKNGANYSVVNLYTRPFTYIGDQFPTPPQASTEATFEAEVKMLSDIFEEEYGHWSYANKLWSGKAPRLSPRQKNEMELLQNTFYKNMKRASVGIQKCFDEGYDKCTLELDSVRTYVGAEHPDKKGKKDIEALTEAESFIQYCDLRTADPGINTTIEALEKYLTTALQIPASEFKGDKCFKYDDQLNSIKELDLSSDIYKVDDLRPLAKLSKLERLNLSKKAIASIAPLAELKNLKVLVLDDNIIEDVTPLADLLQLETLSLQNNQLSDVSALSRLRKLKSLDARGNSKDIKCPLENQNRCKLLDFSNSINLSLNSNQCESRVGHQAISIGNDQVLVTGGYSSDGITLYKSSTEIRRRDGCSPLNFNMLYGRADHQMTVLANGKILITGGHTDSAEVLDPVARKSVPVNNRMQSVRSQHTATLLNDGRVLIVGGYTDISSSAVRTKNISAAVDIYNPNTNSFESFPSLMLPRAEHTATALPDGRVLIVGGFAGQRMTDIIEVLDPHSRTLTSFEEPLQVGRSSHTATLLADGRILIAGGYKWEKRTEGGELRLALAPVGALEIIDPLEESSNSVAENLSEARGAINAWLTKDGRVMLIGGETQGTIFTDLQVGFKSASAHIEIFDPNTEGLYKVGSLNYPRYRATATPLGDRGLLIIGGVGSSSSNVTSELIVYRTRN